MWRVLPTYPLLPGATFQTTLRAHTGYGGAAFALSTWLVQIPIDPRLSFVSISSKKYDPAKNVVRGVLKITSTPKSTQSDDDLTDTNLELAVITFRVKSDTSSGKISSALTLFIDDMVTSSSEKEVNDQAGKLFSTDGVTESGAIVVEEEATVGLQAFVADHHEQELVNLARLGASTLASASDVPIAVRSIRSCHTKKGSVVCSEEGNEGDATTSVAWRSSRTLQPALGKSRAARCGPPPFVKLRLARRPGFCFSRRGDHAS